MCCMKKAKSGCWDSNSLPTAIVGSISSAVQPDGADSCTTRICSKKKEKSTAILACSPLTSDALTLAQLL